MSQSNYLKGYKNVKISYGSSSQMNSNEEERLAGLSHSWKIYVRAPKEFFKTVTFKLHESFINPVITVAQEPFEIYQKGWGEFTVQIKATLFNNDKINFSHYLKLHETKKLIINENSGKPLISEKIDTVFYRGKFNTNEPENYQDKDEAKRIDKAIDYVLEEIEKIK
ncbi:TFIIF small subfamily put [Nucleospora cyclopteri]